MKVLTILLAAVVLMALAFAGLALTILVKKGGKFPNTHVSGNKFLREKGVYCAQTQDKLEQKQAWKKKDFSDLKVDQGK
jgi:hypothetical protein